MFSTRLQNVLHIYCFKVNDAFSGIKRQAHTTPIRETVFLFNAANMKVISKAHLSFVYGRFSANQQFTAAAAARSVSDYLFLWQISEYFFVYQNFGGGRN